MHFKPSDTPVCKPSLKKVYILTDHTIEETAEWVRQWKSVEVPNRLFGAYVNKDGEAV